MKKDYILYLYHNRPVYGCYLTLLSIAASYIIVIFLSINLKIKAILVGCSLVYVCMLTCFFVLLMVLLPLILDLDESKSSGRLHMKVPLSTRMVRWMCGTSLSDRLSSVELRRRVGVCGGDQKCDLVL